MSESPVRVQPTNQPTGPSTSAPAQATDPDGRGAGWRPGLVVRLLLLMMLSELAFICFVYPLYAIPAISAEFQTTQLVWLSVLMTLPSAVLTPLIGKIGDRVGKKKTIMVILALVAIGSTISALAPTFEVLLAGRALQGLSLTTAFLLAPFIKDTYPARTVPLAVSLAGGGAGILSIVMTLVSGSILAAFGWRAAFGAAAVLAVPLFLLFLLVPEGKAYGAKERLDLLGAALLGLGVGGALLAVSFGPVWGWTSPLTIAMAALGLALIAIWWWRSLRVTQPLVDLREFKNPRMLSGLVLIVPVFATASIMLFVMATVLVAPAEGAWGLGLDLTQQSLVASLYYVGGFVGSFLVGLLITRLGSSRVAVGLLALLLIGMILAVAGLHNLPLFAIAIFIVGVLNSGGLATGFVIVVETLAPERQAASTGVVSLVGSVVGAIMPVVITSMMNSMTPSVDGAPGVYPLLAVQLAFAIPGVITAVAFVIAIFLSRRQKGLPLDVTQSAA